MKKKWPGPPLNLIKEFSDKTSVQYSYLNGAKISDIASTVIAPMIKEYILDEINSQPFSIIIDGYSKKHLKLLGIMLVYFSKLLNKTV